VKVSKGVLTRLRSFDRPQKRKSTEKTREQKKEAALEARKVRKAKRAVIFKRAEQYVNEYKKSEREEIRLRRAAKASGDFYVPAQPKVYFVMRIKGINNIAPKPKKILQLLRLLQINNGVFVKVTKATSQMLLIVEPYITYGEPNLKTIRELIYKRGYGKINKQRVPLSSNAVIEGALGATTGIVCIEDIVHEIATAGPHFKQVSNFLWPFKLSNPLGGSRVRKFRQFIEGSYSFLNDRTAGDDSAKRTQHGLGCERLDPRKLTGTRFYLISCRWRAWKARALHQWSRSRLQLSVCLGGHAMSTRCWVVKLLMMMLRERTENGLDW